MTPEWRSRVSSSPGGTLGPQAAAGRCPLALTGTREHLGHNGLVTVGASLTSSQTHLPACEMLTSSRFEPQLCHWPQSVKQL